MDARLLLEGYVPIVDFGSRQPFYVLVLAVFLKFFGISYKVGRLVPMISNIATGFVIFLIGSKIYNRKVGLLAATVFLFLPLVLVWSTVVKTEPLASFLASVSIFFVVRSQIANIRRSSWLIIAGLFAGLAYFVRQPTIAVPAAIILFLILNNHKEPKFATTGVFLFITGYLATCFAVWAFYIGKMQLYELLMSQLNPINVVINRILHTLGMIPEAQRVVDTQGFRILDQGIDQTLTVWRQTFFSVAFLIFGAGAYIVWVVRDQHKSEITQDNAFAWRLLGIWAVLVILLYIFQSVNRGFFSQYFTEALPPLCILTAAFLYKMFHKLKTNTSGFTVILFSVILFYLVFLGQHLFWRFFPGIIFYVFIAPLVVVFLIIGLFPLRESKLALILAVFAGACLSAFAYVISKTAGAGDVGAFVVASFVLFLSLMGSRRRWAVAVHSDWLVVTMLILIGTLSVVTAGYSGWLIGPKYDSVWAPKTVSEVVKVLKSNGEQGDVVLSGGMIWQLEANFRTFSNVAHPTEFQKKKYRNFEIEFEQQRPRFFIDDGYTQRKYGRYAEFLTNELEQNYRLVADISGSRYPVKIYKLRKSRFEEDGVAFAYTQSENKSSRKFKGSSR